MYRLISLDVCGVVCESRASYCYSIGWVACIYIWKNVLPHDSVNKSINLRILDISIFWPFEYFNY
jgi:hypothetical protein